MEAVNSFFVVGIAETAFKDAGDCLDVRLFTRDNDFQRHAVDSFPKAAYRGIGARRKVLGKTVVVVGYCETSQDGTTRLVATDLRIVSRHALEMEGRQHG